MTSSNSIRSNTDKPRAFSKLALIFVTFVAVVAYICKVHPDFVILVLPKYYDAYFMRALYPRDRKNEGATSLPLLSRLIPTPMSDHVIEDCLASKKGTPVLVKRFIDINVTRDRDVIVSKLEKANAGKSIRLLDFSKWNTPHFSTSCSNRILSGLEEIDFDVYARRHMLGDAANNHTFLYAGFESITSPDEVEDITRYNWREKTGEYKQNNLFISNFPHEIVTAPLHAAPVDSFSVQLFGTKTWYFISPEEFASFHNIPMPTLLSLPLTDDELIAKLKNVIVIKQEPGDLIYFGPNWGHVVSTSSGPNMMFNIRINAVPKVRSGPKSLFLKLAIRIRTRVLSGTPQDTSTFNFPLLYDDLNSYYPDCGHSEAFTKLQAIVKADHEA